MLTNLLMVLLITAMIVCTLYGMQYDSEKNTFFSIPDTVFFRSFWCVIVILVHVPASYQNKMQDMIGSFAYIGVTFFFMTSAYGLKYGIKYKKDYLEHFWQNRLMTLLPSALLANAFGVIMNGLVKGRMQVISFVNIDSWVKVLLLFYFIFWLVYKILPETWGGLRDVIICGFVISCSLINRLTDFKITLIWIVEPLGFIYGIIAANYAGWILEKASKKWLHKSVLLMVASLILGLAYLKYKSLFFIGDYLLKIGLGIAITVFVCQVSVRFRLGNGMNLFIGHISYEIYLLHGGIFELLSTLDKRGEMDSGLYILVGITVTILFSVLLNRVSDCLRRMGGYGEKQGR